MPADPNCRLSGYQRLPTMLSKDVKDILEGVHFFLTEALKDEELSGKVECMRGGLILQLEALRQAYPILHFSSSGNPLAPHTTSLAPPPYTEQSPHNVVTSSRLSTCSGSTSNYSTSYSNSSSTGYSEGPGGLLETREEEETDYEEEEIYEEFDGSNLNQVSPVGKPKSKDQKLSRSDSRSSHNKLEENYLDDVEPVSFSVLIAKCDCHGAVTKRSKGFLRNSRFQAVLANKLLYLYHKESDDQQKKVIDLSGYSVRNSSTEDNRTSKKKNFAFDLFGDSKKTHIFNCTSERERDKWTLALSQCLASSTFQPQHEQACSQRVPAIPPITNPVMFNAGEQMGNNFPQSEEIYEELNSESDPLESTEIECTHNGLNDYQVPEDDDQKPLPPPFPPGQLLKAMRNAPPARPPLPEILRKPPRPLPEAPEESYDRPEDDLDIYCEIDDDSFESLGEPNEDNPSLLTESINNPLISSRSLSQEIFDTIKEKVPQLPNRSVEDDSHNCSVEEFEELNYDIPLENTPVFKPTLQRPLKQNDPPPIPLKGSIVQTEEDDSEYKVPSSIIPQAIYQVPSSIPVLVKKSPSASINLGMKNESQIKSKSVNRALFSAQTDKKQERETTPSGEMFSASNSVKDLVALLNKNEIERNSINVSTPVSKPASVIKISRDAFMQQQLEEKNNEAEIVSKEAPRPLPLLASTKEAPVDYPSKVDRIKAVISRGKTDKTYSDVYVAKFAFIAPSEGFLSFNRGDEVVVTEAPANSSWWNAIIKGKKGCVPKEYIRIKN